jgi:hypothetical protein
VLFYLYLIGMPLFAFLAWVFSEAFHAGETVRDRVRLPLVVASGLLWPVLLVGVAQIQAVRIRAKLMKPAHQGLNGFTANCRTR